jgi:hypothetical protein
MQSRIIAAVVSFVLSFVTTGFAQSGATFPHNNYADGKSWLCHPGLTGTAGACDIDLRTTIIRADGTSTVENSKQDPHATDRLLLRVPNSLDRSHSEQRHESRYRRTQCRALAIR